MIFLNPLPIFVWLIPMIPLLIFLINNRRYKKVKFSSIRFLSNLKSSQINRLRLLNILLLILRTLILILILFIIMKPHKYSMLNSNNIVDDKVLNIILIDDSFSNKHGYIYNQDRILIMDDIINGICQNFPIKSKLKIITLAYTQLKKT